METKKNWRISEILTTENCQGTGVTSNLLFAKFIDTRGSDMNSSLNASENETKKMAQWVKVIDVSPSGLSLIPRTQNHLMLAVL